MFRALPMDEMVRTVAELGCQYIELSPRDDFMPFFLHPRADDERIVAMKKSLRTHGVKLASALRCTRGAPPAHHPGSLPTATGRPDGAPSGGFPV